MNEDRRRIAFRLGVLQYTVVVVFSALTLGFWFFQVVQHDRYEELAANNHQRTLALRAPRGMLFDRNGKVLVENRSSFTISILREHTKNMDHTIRLLSTIAGLDEHEVREIVQRYKREPAYRPILVVEDATLAQVAAVTARRLDFEMPDVVVEEVPTRKYPTDALAAHLIGYVGEAGEKQVKAENLSLGAIVGQSGVEKAYNTLLMGEDGARRVVVNSVGREIRTLEEIQPKDGRRVQLTIDYDMQRAAEEGFRQLGYYGAAVVIDPRTGEVLAFTSLPAYDPNDFTGAGITPATWSALNTDQLKPLQNRAIQGRYSPGSTFKIVVATAALEEKLITPDFKVSCSGAGTFYGRSFKCWKAGGHGTVDLQHALEQSCNVYFYTVGNMLGVDRIHKWAELLGISEKSEIDLPNEVQSIIPSTEWKRRTTGEKWYAGETISVAIGQGAVSVTPVSMAVMMSTVANGGTRWAPRLIKAIDEGQGWKPFPVSEPLSKVSMAPSTVQAVHQGLWLVVNAAGTGGRARIVGRDVSGKTGTAQVISLEGGRAAAGRTAKDLRDHGWFVFFAPRDNPEVAGVIFAEHAEHGSSAAPIAKYVMETYFAKRDGQPLPVWPKTTAPSVAPPSDVPPAPAVVQNTPSAISGTN
ncbi:MAG TPA: penicillin-binding protein 2 [Vicinamibacterales bacterium]|jgi:penicillin-binding protein 2